MTTVAFPLVRGQSRLLAEGDSFTMAAGAGGVTDWPELAAAANSKISLLNRATGGDRLGNVSGRATIDDANIYPSWRNCLGVWIGLNDITFAQTQGNPAGYISGTTIPAYASYIAARIAAGWSSVFCFTLTPWDQLAGFQALRLQLNTAIRATTGAVIVDVAADANIGSNSANTTYFQAGNLPHLTQAGQAIVASLFATAATGRF